jgi:hypothetical protein
MKVDGVVMTHLGTHALRLAQRELRVFPCVERGKTPAIKDNLKVASVDNTVIGVWWKSHGFNIGVATGPRSGVWVLDIDGEEGERTVRRLEAEHSALPPTVEAVTGKGRHLYFRWPDGETIRNSQLRFDLPGFEWRGEGGYVLAPPSVHPSGRVYAWSVDSAPEFADAPEWLLDIVAGRERAGTYPGKADGAEPTPSEVWRVLLDQNHEGSHRGSAVARLARQLLRRYVDPYATLGMCHVFNERRCVEPLARTEVFRIVNDIARREADRRAAQQGEQGG